MGRLGFYEKQLIVARGGWNRPMGSQFGSLGRSWAVRPAPGSYGNDYSYTQSIMPGETSELGAGFFGGRSAEWMSDMQATEEQLLMINNKIFAIGQPTWDWIHTNIRGGGVDFIPYSDAQGDLLVSIKQFTAPSGGEKENILDSQIAKAKEKIQRYTGMASYAMAKIPEDSPIATHVEVEQGNLRAQLANLPDYKSPSAAFRQAFLQNIADRAGAIIDWGKYVVPAAIVLGILILLPKLKLGKQA